jgi:hypothetical protein
MRQQAMVCFIFTLTCAAALGDDKKETPKEAKTTADILKGVEPLKGFGIVSTAEFRNPYEQTFVVWYNPYSGEAACNVSAYRFDAKKERWVRFLGKEFEGTHDVSVESGRGFTIRNVNGEVVYQEKVKN